MTNLAHRFTELPIFRRLAGCLATGLLATLLAGPLAAEQPSAEQPSAAPKTVSPADHREVPSDPYLAGSSLDLPRETARRWHAHGLTSVQVNVDAMGNNIVGDAANEPSIAVDPTDASRIAIGWRQFDSIASSFRQAGWGWSNDGGQSWQASVIDGGTFRSDPVLAADANGVFYYNSLAVPGGNFQCDVFRSGDGGQTWDAGVFAFGGDKQWMAIDDDPGPGLGRGHIYHGWNQTFSCCGNTGFTRSTDGGDSYETAISVPEQPFWGTQDVASNGDVYFAGVASSDSGLAVVRSTSLDDPGMAPAFNTLVRPNLGGEFIALGGPNPAGLLGQVWVVADPARPGSIYVLASVDPPGDDPLDVHFIRSTDNGETWSAPVRLNDDAADTNAWQWFGTLSVATDGRLDATWNDSRNDPGGFDSQLFYTTSSDGGLTWSANQPLTQSFDPHLGWPQQNKIGDYNDQVSDLSGTHLTYAATFNGEQDVYYLFIPGAGLSIFFDGFESGDTDAWSSSGP